MFYDFRLIAWLSEKVARVFAGKIVEGDHHEPDESDWSWETDLEETSLQLPPEFVPRFFAVLSKLFDRGFGPPQIEIIENLTTKLQFGQTRQLNFNPGRKGKPVTLQILLCRLNPETFTVGIRSTPAMVKAIDGLIAHFQASNENED